MKIQHALGAVVLLVSMFCLSAANAAGEYKGTWSILKSEHAGQVRFGIQHRAPGSHMQHEADWPASEFSGVNFAAPGKQDVTFQIVREAGRLDCEGYLNQGEGTGIFRYTPNPGFVKAMSAEGFDGIDEPKQFAMTIHDVTTSYARALKAEKLSGLDTDKLLAFSIFDVTPQFIRELRAEGLPANEADRLIAFRVHDVTPALVKELRNAGLELDEDMLVAFRVHDVSPEYIQKIEELGFDRPKADQLVAMRVHDVSPEFIKQMRSRGLKNLTIDQLINLRVHGIE